MSIISLSMFLCHVVGFIYYKMKTQAKQTSEYIWYLF